MRSEGRSASRGPVSIRPVEESDRDAVLDLCQEMFELDGSRLGPVWKWLFDENPIAESAPLKGLVLEANGEIVGHSGIIPQRFCVAGRALVFSFASAFCVAPAYRFHGTRLAHAFLAHPICRFPLTNSGNASTVAIYKFFGSREVPGLADNDYVLPVRVDRLVRHRLSRHRRLAALRAASPLLRWIGPAMTAVIRARYDGSYLVTRCEDVGEEFDSLWRRLSGSYPVLGARTREYLAWRYFGHPGRPYRFFAARDAGRELVGYVVCHLGDEESGLRILNVVDLFCDHANVRLIGALVSKMIAEAMECRADAVRIQDVPDRVKVVLARMGFVRRSRPNRAVYRNNCGVAEAVLSASRSWYCSTGDGDGDAGVWPRARGSNDLSPASTA